jgi:hypothetical protein
VNITWKKLTSKPNAKKKCPKVALLQEEEHCIYAVSDSAGYQMAAEEKALLDHLDPHTRV